MFKGLIFEGDQEVGSFLYFGKTIGQKIKKINSVTVKSEYIDIIRGHSNKQLIYKYFSGNNPIVLGFGHIYFDSAFVSNLEMLIKEGFLINSLIKDKYEN